MTGRYLDRHPAANATLKLIDSLIDLFPSRPSPAIAAPKRLLLANAAHIGDVVISTSLLPAIRKAFPACSIGFLAGSWSRDVLTNSPYVDQVHVLDHWRLNRSSVSQWQKAVTYLSMRARVLKELRQVSYDMAIDLYTCFPNFIPVLWQAGIPVRIGFVSSGFGGLLTHGELFPHKPLQPERQNQSTLLRLLPAPAEAWNDAGNGLLSMAVDLSPLPAGLADKGYVVLHMGTGAPERRWPADKWKHLSSWIQKNGLQVVLTGAGQADRQLVDALKDCNTDCIDLCDAIEWNTFLQVVSRAALLVGVESMAGHIAAALGTPYVVIYAGITQHERWGPSGSGKVLTHQVPCSPCFRKGGCIEMRCVREVTTDEVKAACALQLGLS